MDFKFNRAALHNASAFFIVCAVYSILFVHAMRSVQDHSYISEENIYQVQHCYDDDFFSDHIWIYEFMPGVQVDIQWVDQPEDVRFHWHRYEKTVDHTININPSSNIFRDPYEFGFSSILISFEHAGMGSMRSFYVGYLQHEEARYTFYPDLLIGGFDTIEQLTGNTAVTPRFLGIEKNDGRVFSEIGWRQAFETGEADRINHDALVCRPVTDTREAVAFLRYAMREWDIEQEMLYNSLRRRDFFRNM
jgi:hypothetical protein